MSSMQKKKNPVLLLRPRERSKPSIILKKN